MPAAMTLDDVLAQLDAIIARSRARESADGYFAALYREVTAAVKQRIADGYFEDAARMERLDVVFASRYLTAYDAFEAGRPASACWEVALRAGRTWRPIVLQHLLAGMNAHINLDLGIAAAEVAPGAAIGALRTDFDRINGVLGSLVNDVQVRLARVWPPLRRIDGLAGDADEAVANFSLGKARAYAWSLATGLAATPTAEARAARIALADAFAAGLGQLILSPGMRGNAMLMAIRLSERGSFSRKLGYVAGGATG